MPTDDTINLRMCALEKEQAAQARDISWMRENLTLARDDHKWKIATVISLLGMLLAIFLAVRK